MTFDCNSTSKTGSDSNQDEIPFFTIFPRFCLGISCCRVIVNALLRTIAFRSTRSLLPLALGKCLHLIVLGHRKPYWHITGAQPLFPWVKREWQGEIWSVTFGWQVGAQMEQRKSLGSTGCWWAEGIDKLQALPLFTSCLTCKWSCSQHLHTKAFSSFHISFLRFYSLRTATRHPLTFPNWGYFRWMNRHWGMRCHWGSIRYNSVSFHARLITDEFRKRFASHAFGPRKAMLTHKRCTTISCPFKNRPTWWNFFLDVWLAGRGIHENRERASGSPNNFAWFFLMISRRTDA